MRFASLFILRPKSGSKLPRSKSLFVIRNYRDCRIRFYSMMAPTNRLKGAQNGYPTGSKDARLPPDGLGKRHDRGSTIFRNYGASLCATAFLWILPDAVRGICSTTWIFLGHLKSARRSRQNAMSSVSVAGARSFTAASTSSP